MNNSYIYLLIQEAQRMMVSGFLNVNGRDFMQRIMSEEPGYFLTSTQRCYPTLNQRENNRGKKSVMGG